MRLQVRSWGTGARTALLVHGFSDDGSTWWQTGPALAALGFTVLAPDLRGHGRSPRADSYRLEDFAQDLVDTLPVGADLALGHSLGALALGVAAPRLLARRSLFVDPPWLRAAEADLLSEPLPVTADELPPVTAGWSPQDVAADLASNALVDPAVGPALVELLRLGVVAPPYAPEPGSVVVVPEHDPALPPESHAVLELLGFTVRTHPAVRHVVHRDDPEGFLTLLRGLLVTDELVA